MDIDEMIASLEPDRTGFFMPAEWEKHKQIWMGWPQRPDVWRDKAGPGMQAFVQVAEAISKFEYVMVGANEEQVKNAESMLPRKNITVVPLPQDDSWFRDTGPVFVVRRGADGRNCAIRGNDFVFNSWGEKNATWEVDDEIADEICNYAGVECDRSEFVLEGGSIHVDGEGTLLTTEECLLNKNRNPSRSREEIEAHLKERLGVKKIIWLKWGLYADEDTNGHIDNFACFVAPAKVLLAWTDDEGDPQYERSKAAYDVLTSTTDAKGRSIEVVKMPVPPPQFITEEESAGIMKAKGAMPREPGTRLAASYVNFLICHGALGLGIVAPALGVPESDDRAKQVLQEVFPGWEVVMVALGREILLGGGNVHCITCQQPLVEK